MILDKASVMLLPSERRFQQNTSDIRNVVSQSNVPCGRIWGHTMLKYTLFISPFVVQDSRRDLILQRRVDGPPPFLRDDMRPWPLVGHVAAVVVGFD